MFTRIVDSIVTHKIWGFPIFFVFLYLMFECTFVFGEYPKGWIEWLVEQIASLAETFMPAGPLKDLIVDGIIGGVGGLSCSCLIFCFSIFLFRSWKTPDTWRVQLLSWIRLCTKWGCMENRSFR